MEPKTRRKGHKKIVNLLALFWGLCEVKIHHKFTDLFLAILSLSSVLCFRCFGFYRQRLQSRKRLKSLRLALWKYWKLDFERRTEAMNNEKAKEKKNINARFNINSNDANKLKDFCTWTSSKIFESSRKKASKSFLDSKSDISINAEKRFPLINDSIHEPINTCRYRQTSTTSHSFGSSLGSDSQFHL